MKIILSVATSLLFCSMVYAQSVFVGPHNFVRAESDRYMNVALSYRTNSNESIGFYVRDTKEVDRLANEAIGEYI